MILEKRSWSFGQWHTLVDLMVLSTTYLMDTYGVPILSQNPKVRYNFQGWDPTYTWELLLKNVEYICRLGAADWCSWILLPRPCLELCASRIACQMAWSWWWTYLYWVWEPCKFYLSFSKRRNSLSVPMKEQLIKITKIPLNYFLNLLCPLAFLCGLGK